jgi:nucleoside-diphosphate-sugar epimerase
LEILGMQVLVTGGAGYVGSRVSAHLLAAGNYVAVYDKLLFGGEGILPLLDHPRFRIIVDDIRNADALRAALRGVDAVVHLAALVGEPACQVDPDATRSINSGGTQLLLRMMQEAGTPRLIFVSTCSNYGVAEPNVLADENSPLRPLSLYAETKVDAEQLVWKAAGGGLDAVILRLGTICGLSTRMRFGLLVNDLARAAATGRCISIFSPDAWRPFLHIADAADAIELSLRAPTASICDQVFNVVGENYQKRQLAELVKKHYPRAVMTITPAETDLRDYRVAAKRIAEHLGFRPVRTVELAFLEITRAVAEGLFPDPFRSLYEALPASEASRELEYRR